MIPRICHVIGNTLLELTQGDITLETTDVIVNAANASLMGGGGVDGAIHRAGGSLILEECKKIRALRGPLPPGEAVITSGGRLKSKYVIHTVGPIWKGGTCGEEIVLKRCYESCLRLAQDHSLESMSFPSVSTGAYGYPIKRAAPIALSTISTLLINTSSPMKLIRFVLFDRTTFHGYAHAFSQIISSSDSMINK